VRYGGVTAAVGPLTAGRPATPTVASPDGLIKQ